MVKKRVGFTLIELLVVIAIIALLAAILFPVFARARENARKSSCLNNLKQLGVGVQQYTQDFDERLPSSTDGNPDGVNVLGGWTFYSVFGASGGKFDPALGSLFPYIKNKQIYICPSDSFGAKTGQSFAINACMVGGTRTGGIRVGRNLTDFGNNAGGTSMWMLFGEENAGGSTDDGYLSVGNAWTPRHLQGTNLTFLDGHVKFVIVENGSLRPTNYQFAGGTACPP